MQHAPPRLRNECTGMSHRCERITRAICLARFVVVANGKDNIYLPRIIYTYTHTSSIHRSRRNFGELRIHRENAPRIRLSRDRKEIALPDFRFVA